LPSPEIRPPKRRTPSPTVEDMPPFKKSSQEYNTLEAHLHDLQALDSDCKGILYNLIYLRDNYALKLI